jgi:ATP-binding cassette subfamily C protein LapB
LLDEPTSMIDTNSERAILDRLAATRQGKTLVVVTHRPALLAIVERIVVLDRGRVVADGPRDEVLAQLRS